MNEEVYFDVFYGTKANRYTNLQIPFCLFIVHKNSGLKLDSVPALYRIK